MKRVELRIDKTDLGRTVDLLVNDAGVVSIAVDPSPPQAISGNDPPSERAVFITPKPAEIHDGGIPLDNDPDGEPDQVFADYLRGLGIAVYAHRMVRR